MNILFLSFIIEKCNLRIYLFHIASVEPLVDVELSESIIWQVITGYLLAGSIVGPGGFNFINEMVQVSGYSNQFLL